MPDPITGVAGSDNLPGTVLDPNSQSDLTLGSDTLDQFGTEVTNPNLNAESSDPKSDPKRFEYHQSRADKAEARTKELEKQLQEKAKFDPLIDLVRRDDESYRFLQNRLSGRPAQTEKPLEAPQRPDSYNEVEAFSNPDSTSFKYRKSLETYKDNLLQQTIKQNADIRSTLEAQKAQNQQREQERVNLAKFRQDVVEKGIADEEFAEFFELVNTTRVDDMVDYFKYKKGRTETTSRNPASMFGRPETSSASIPRPAKRGEAADIGKSLVELSRNM